MKIGKNQDPRKTACLLIRGPLRIADFESDRSALSLSRAWALVRAKQMLAKIVLFAGLY